MLQRIDNETAIALKELGINEPCDMMYREGELKGTKLGMHSKPNDYEGYYAAYYLDEVMKIFRDEYNVDIYTRSSYMGYYSIIEYDLPKKSGFFPCDLHSTYEEAQLAGIKKTIKILKDEDSRVKEKD